MSESEEIDLQMDIFNSIKKIKQNRVQARSNPLKVTQVKVLIHHQIHYLNLKLTMKGNIIRKTNKT